MNKHIHISSYPSVILICLFLVVALAGFRVEKPATPYTLPELRYFPPLPVTNNPPTIEGVDLGRHLFYDPILSVDSSLSCAHCHRQEAAFSDAPKKFSTGIRQTPMKRNTMPLFNLAWYPAFFWDGRAADLESQVFQPVRAHDEMDLDWETAVQRIAGNTFYRARFRSVFGSVQIDSNLVAKAIAQFERVLISNRSRYDSVLARKAYFTPEESEGFRIVNDQSKGDCLHCHPTDAQALGTTGQFSNNGLDAFTRPEQFTDPGRGGVSNLAKDTGLFRIPSLRNIALTAPYMHDGRFQTLEEVIDFYSEGVHASYNIDSKMQYAYRHGVHFTAEDKAQVLAFLKTLTDSAFITDPAFGNPW
ncbi:MAG: cytochrome-c peroxidase [Flavobacteriales bacterium]|nr:cytochrome-c peroxidase [Flavobacteriales bacterium]MCB9449064.1 cytochrome-c peroxidase [Flavobacteriales bacterium]